MEIARVIVRGLTLMSAIYLVLTMIGVIYVLWHHQEIP
jgi:hypothetical protein